MTDHAIMGDNLPPEPIDDQLTRFTNSAADFERAYNDFLMEGDGINDAETAARAAVFIKQINLNLDDMKKAKTESNAPHYEKIKRTNAAYQAIEAHFVKMKTHVGTWLTAYQVRLDQARQAQRMKAEAEAQRKREEAEAAAEELRKAHTASIQDQFAAQRLQEEAETAERAAEEAKKPTVIRSEYGQTASMRKTWVYKVDDYDKVDRAALVKYLDKAAIDKAIRAHIRATKDGGPDKINGVEFYEETTTVVS